MKVLRVSRYAYEYKNAPVKKVTLEGKLITANIRTDSITLALKKNKFTYDELMELQEALGDIRMSIDVLEIPEDAESDE